MTAKELYFQLKKHKNIVFFLCGFLLDAITIDRIDAWADIALQIGYLVGLSFLLLYQYRENKQLWIPGKLVKRFWPYNVELLHFFYGGLLSAYVILYLKSTSGARTLVFLVFLTVLLIINEMPQVRHYGYRLRLGLYAFCVTSFMIYFVSIVIGRMGAWVFLLSIVISVSLVWLMATKLAAKEDNPKRSRVRLFLPAGFLFLAVLTLYFLRLIPPVPLSVQYQGVFHQVYRDGDNFRLRYTKPPFYAFWRNDSQPYLSREGDSIYYFTRVFAPSRFKTQVNVRWELFNEKKRKYETTDLIPLDIVGGRAQGFRGYVSKENHQPGKYRVSTETSDKRTIGLIRFKVKEDASDSDRKFVDLKM